MKHTVYYLFLILAFCSCKAQPEDRTKITHIYHREFGEGLPIVLINGGPGMNSEGFSTLAHLLAVKYKVILFDQRGTGRSIMDTVNEKTITMDAMVQDMEELRNTLRIKEWVVMGHSFGGMLASYYATQHPENCKGLILSSSGGIDLDLLTYVNNAIHKRLTAKEEDSLQYWNEQIRKGDTSYAARLGRGRSLAPAYLERKEYVPVVAVRLAQTNMQVNQLVFADMQRIHFDCSKGLRTFHKPVLIIQGQQDVVNKASALKAKAVMPQADTVFIGDCSHYGWLEQKDKYIGALFTFLEKNF